MALSKLKGATTDVLLWSPLEEVEEEAQKQLVNAASLAQAVKVLSMPDVHTGYGVAVGSVVALKDAVCPNIVGVDIGCVDAETEFLSPTGWKRIADYDGSLIAEYDSENGKTFFREPKAFIKLPCEWFYRLKTKYGVDQMLSPEHKVLYAQYDRGYKFDRFSTITAEELAQTHGRTVLGFRGRFLTTFTPELKTRLALSDEELRVLVMVAADGHVRNWNTGNCVLNFKKARKIERAQQLLEAADIDFTLNEGEVTQLSFTPAFPPTKTLGTLWEASLEQLKIIASEVLFWDGNHDEHCFYTRDRASADFVSYVFAATGSRSVLREDTHKDGKVDFRVFAQGNTKVGIYGSPKASIEKISSKDGLKYCFTTSTGYWVMRRGGNVVITGNCGMMAHKTNLKADDLPKDLAPLRARIEEFIPMGAGQNHATPSELTNAPEYTDLWARVAAAEQTKCTLEKAKQQMGTLGSGNHFIEVCLDKDDSVWLMLHSGSRNFGLQVAESHQWKASLLPVNAQLPDQSLAVLPRGTPDFDAYWRDMQTAQLYAKLNRDTMFELLLQALRAEGLNVQMTNIGVNCHHNYAVEEVHEGQTLVVARKGAISAKRGEMGIIPGAMGRRSFIVEGLGSLESLMSASHGAGRRMSRSKANKTFSLDDLRASTKGVECYIGKGVIDEIGEAYKDIDRVMANQSDLVKPLYELHAVLCAKGHSDQNKHVKADRKEQTKERDNDRRDAREHKDKRRWS